MLQVGVYDELSLQRMDLIISEAGKNGIYLILPMVNHWGDLGGMQWYVDQVRLLTMAAGLSAPCGIEPAESCS